MNLQIDCLIEESFDESRENALDDLEAEDVAFEQYLLDLEEGGERHAERRTRQRPRFLSPVEDQSLQPHLYTPPKNSSSSYYNSTPNFMLPYKTAPTNFYTNIPPRSGHTTCSVGHLIYCYGGTSVNVLAEMWCYNTENHLWHRCSGVYSCFQVRMEEAYFLHLQSQQALPQLESLPVPRAKIASSLVSNYNPKIDNWRSTVLYLFGGCTGMYVVNEMFTFQCSTRKWNRVKQRGKIPSPRSNHSCAMINNLMIIFGGLGQETTDILGDTYVFDTNTHTWLDINQTQLGEKPPASRSHVYCVYNQKLIICFGGHENFELNQIYSFDPKILKWSRIIPNSCNIPSPRFFASGGLIDDYLIIIGGRQSDNRKNSVWVFDFLNKTWNDQIESLYSRVGTDKRTLVDPSSLEHIPHPTEQQFREYHEKRSILQIEAEAKANELLEVDSNNIFAHTKKYKYLYHLLPMKRTGHQCSVVGPQKKLYLIGGALKNEIKVGDVWTFSIQSRQLPNRLQRIKSFFDVQFVF